MKSILTVVGLSLFFIVAISGVLIAQRQSQVKEAVAPNVPVSQPSAATPVTPTNACQKSFDVAFTPGTNTPAAYACDAPCTDDYQCKDTTKGGKAEYICYRHTAGTASDWVSWLNISEAAVISGNTGYLTSFTTWNQPDGSIKQYAVKGGKLYVRTSDAAGTNWSALIENSAVDRTGTGTLTSFSTAKLRNNTYEQHAVKGGVIWRRTSPDNSNWGDPWVDHTSFVSAHGTGVITSFSQFIQPDGILKQFYVRGGKLLVREHSTAGGWTEWAENSALDVGTGDYTSFSGWEQKDKSIKQFAVRGGVLYARDNAGGKCRLSTLPTAADCKAVVAPGVASCTSKKAFTDYSTVTTATEITADTPLKKGQEFVYRITVAGSTPEAKNVTVSDQLPTSLAYVGPVGDSVITHSNGLVTATLLTVGATPRVIEFKVKVAAAVADGADIVNEATIKTEGANPSDCSVSLKVESKQMTYACNSQCTDDSQCKAVNADWVCASDQGNRCRLDSNRGSDSCTPRPQTYACNSSCDNDEQCKSYNVSYKCYPAGGTTGKVCRLATNETNASCNNPSAPPPVPAVGCNTTCSTTADCSNSNHICYDTALVGQSSGKVCRLANYVNSSTCTSPSTTTTYTPPTDTKGGQPALPAELPQSGPAEWMAWLKAGLITLGVGAALLLLL